MPGGQSHKYIGAIKEDGLHPAKHRQRETIAPLVSEPVTLENLDIITSEYGFSKAMLDICPESWKESIGVRWKDVLVEIIVGQSPHSYLKERRNSDGLRVHIGNQRRFLQKEMGLRIEELWLLLGNISWIRGNGSNGISALNSEQTSFIHEHHICLEVIS